MSVESYGFKFVVDAKDAAKGYGDFQKAVDGVFASLAKFEAQAKKSIDSVTSSTKRGQGDVAKYASQFKALASIPVDSKAAPALQKLTAAMSGFKAPNQTAITNMRSFFKALDTLPNLGASTRSVSAIANLSSALEGFKAPSSAQSTRLVEFGKALQKIAPALTTLKGVSGLGKVASEVSSLSTSLDKLKVPSAASVTNLNNFAKALQNLKLSKLSGSENLASTLNAFNGFKAPSAAQARNLQQFITALNELKMPQNAKEISLYLEKVAAAAGGANASLKNFRGSLNSVSWGTFNSGASHARLEMMGLQNAFSGTFQAGSLLRSLLGSLTIGELGRSFFEATQTANQFHASMEVLGESPLMQSAAWDRVRQDANHFGADLKTYAEGFSKFAAAANESGMKIGDSFKVYEGFQTVMSTLHLGTEQQQSVGLAIREIMDRGYVSTQQLTRQLGLVLPGALHTLQEAWKESGKKGVSFFDALKKKMVDGQWALDKLSEHYKEVYGPALAKALESPIQQFNILKNNVMDTMVAIGDAGAKKGFADLVKQISGYIDPKATNGFAQAVGGALTNALNRASNALKYLHDNWDSIKGPLTTALSLLGKWMVLSAGLAIGRSILGPLMALRTGFQAFNGVMAGTATRAAGMSRVWSTITAGTVPLNTGIKNLNASGFVANGMFNALNSTSRLAGVQFAAFSAAAKAPTLAMNVLQGSLNAVKGAGSGLMSLVGGPWGAALIGLGVIAGSVGSEIMSLGMHHADAGRIIAGTRGVFEENVDLLGKTATNALMARGGMQGFGAQAGAQTGVVTSFAGVVGNLADQLYRAADAARKANIANIQGQISALDQTIATRSKDTVSSVFAGGYQGGSLKDRWSRGTHRLGVLVNSVWDGGADDAAAKRDVAEAARKRAALNPLLQAAQKEDTLGFTKRTKMDQLYQETHPTSAIYGGANADKKKKGRKGPSERSLAMKNENADDSIMADLNKFGDKNAKLYDEFTKTVTKEAQYLLNNKAFKQFAQGVQIDAKTGKMSVDGLVHALENGGIKGKALDDLKKRYGKSVADIIGMLKEQQKEFNDKVRDNTVTEIEKKTKDYKEAMKEIDKHNPVQKVMDEYSDGLKTSASKLLQTDEYLKWLKDTETASDGAATATARLIALINGGKLSEDTMAALRARGMSAGGLASQISKDGTLNAQDVQLKKEEADITITLNKEYQKEAAFLQMTSFQQEVANKLIKVAADIKKQGNLVTQQAIDLARTQIELGQREIDMLKEKKKYLENNGLKKYSQDVQTAGEFVHEFDSHMLKGLEDTLYKLGTTGKLSFKGLIDGMQSDMIRFASQNLVKKFTDAIGGKESSGKADPMTPIGGFIGKLFGMKKDSAGTGFQYKPRGETPIAPMYVSVVPGTGELDFGVGGKGKGLLSGLVAGDTPGLTKLGASAVTPMYVRNADGLPGLGGILGKGGAANNGALPGDPVKAFADGITADKPNSPLNATKDSLNSGAAAAAPGITNSFNSMFKNIAPSLGIMLAGAAGSAVGGTKGQILSTVLDIGMMFLTKGSSGGMKVPGHLEGGITGQAVSSYSVSPAMFRNAPHYAEGTANTSDGGHPAILHDNEAVIPLSRGRKVAVELTGNGSRATAPVINNNFTVNSPDADSFRKSKSQIATELHMMGARSWQRNND